jgi:hypothetical protein
MVRMVCRLLGMSDVVGLLATLTQNEPHRKPPLAVRSDSVGRSGWVCAKRF